MSDARAGNEQERGRREAFDELIPAGATKDSRRSAEWLEYSLLVDQGDVVQLQELGRRLEAITPADPDDGCQLKLIGGDSQGLVARWQGDRLGLDQSVEIGLRAIQTEKSIEPQNYAHGLGRVGCALVRRGYVRGVDPLTFEDLRLGGELLEKAIERIEELPESARTDISYRRSAMHRDLGREKIGELFADPKVELSGVSVAILEKARRETGDDNRGITDWATEINLALARALQVVKFRSGTPCTKNYPYRTPEEQEKLLVAATEELEKAWAWLLGQKAEEGRFLFCHALLLNDIGLATSKMFMATEEAEADAWLDMSFEAVEEMLKLYTEKHHGYKHALGHEWQALNCARRDELKDAKNHAEAAIAGYAECGNGREHEMRAELAYLQSLTRDSKTRYQEKDDRKKGTREIGQERTTATDIKVGEDFAGAVARARDAVGEVAARLQERLDQARRFVPSEKADKEELIAEVDAALELGIEVSVDGVKMSKLMLRGVSLTWQYPDGYKGFKKYAACVETPQTIPQNSLTTSSPPEMSET